MNEPLFEIGDIVKLTKPATNSYLSYFKPGQELEIINVRPYSDSKIVIKILDDKFTSNEYYEDQFELVKRNPKRTMENQEFLKVMRSNERMLEL